MSGSEDPRNGQSGWDAGQAGSGLDWRSPGRRPPRARRPPLRPPVLHARPTRGCVPEGAWPGCSPGSKELNANRAQPRPGQAAQPEPGGEAEQQPPARLRPRGARPPAPRSAAAARPRPRPRAERRAEAFRRAQLAGAAGAGPGPSAGPPSSGRERESRHPGSDWAGAMASAACPGPGDPAM